jgi:mono/diheme cytochrome c family protein
MEAFSMRPYGRGLIALALALVAGCGSGTKSASSTASTASLTSQAASLENGRSIFQTGKDSNGVQITAKPLALMNSCAACHRADGSGGLHLPGGAVSADLRYKALVSSQTQPYTLPLLERAISTGIDDDGQALSPVMPRWKLSARDLHDVSTYVLTQLK